LLKCDGCEAWYPIVRGIPRMLPDAMNEHWPVIQPLIPEPVPPSLTTLTENLNSQKSVNYDRQTRENFSYEWDNHKLAGTTWGMQLSDRVKWFFIEPLRIKPEELRGKVMLDAGCGNGSQSVAYSELAYSELGLEVIAVDLSSGLEHGYAYRRLHAGAVPEKVHFVQGNLQRPPLAPGSVDIIHSAGVLHHTPDTLQTFRALRALLRPGGTFYVWLYKYEKLVTPVVNSMRVVTTRISPRNFARIAQAMSVPFIAFCKTVNALGIRSYSAFSKREAALALMDIFGAPYAYYHSFDEVAQWYSSAGFSEVWPCNDGRRGFGVCGRIDGAHTATQETIDKTANSFQAQTAGDPAIQGKGA
jgi:SAM-dependent methyltransferase